MASAQQSPSQQPATTWTEPPWCGWIETTGDALLILEAARQGLIPRVTRRLVDSERKMIGSGSVFVFDEDESGIKRWTDGFFWSPSRILGNFLLYRETDKRGAGHRSIKADQELNGEMGDGQSRRADNLLFDKTRERSLVGSLTNSYKFKPDGLMKKTFSLTIGGVAQHLISYYKIEDVESGRLRSPSSLPELASLDISPEYLDKTHFRNPPKVETGADGIPRYRGEADDIESPSSAHHSGPFSSPNIQLLTDARTTESRVAESSTASKKTNRYNPINRPRKNTATKSSPPDNDSPTNETPLPPDANSASSVPLPPTPPPSSYSENLAPIHGPIQHAYPPYGMGPFYPTPVYHHPPPMHPGAYPSPVGVSNPNHNSVGPTVGSPYPLGYPSYPPVPGQPMNGAATSPPPAPQTHGSDPSQAGLGPSTSGPQPATPAPSTPSTQGPPGPPVYHQQGQPPSHYAYYYAPPHPGYPPPGSYQWSAYPPHPPPGAHPVQPGIHTHQNTATTSSANSMQSPVIQQPQQPVTGPADGNGDTNMANGTTT